MMQLNQDPVRVRLEEKASKGLLRKKLPLGKEYGLSATYEEFKAYMDALSNTGEGELSEKELSQVAGGKESGDKDDWVCSVISNSY